MLLVNFSLISARSFSCSPFPWVAKMIRPFIVQRLSFSVLGHVLLTMTRQVIHGNFSSSIFFIVSWDACFALSLLLVQWTTGSMIVTGIFSFVAYSIRSRVSLDPVILSPYFLAKSGLWMIARKHQTGNAIHLRKEGSRLPTIWYQTKIPVPSGSAKSEFWRTDNRSLSREASKSISGFGVTTSVALFFVCLSVARQSSYVLL